MSTTTILINIKIVKHSNIYKGKKENKLCNVYKLYITSASLSNAAQETILGVGGFKEQLFYYLL